MDACDEGKGRRKEDFVRLHKPKGDSTLEGDMGSRGKRQTKMQRNGRHAYLTEKRTGRY